MACREPTILLTPQARRVPCLGAGRARGNRVWPTFNADLPISAGLKEIVHFFL